MSEYYGVIRSANSLQHHGIKGQKWGVRRFQNLDVDEFGRCKHE